MGVFFNKDSVLHELEIKDADGNKVPLEDEETPAEETPPVENPEEIPAEENIPAEEGSEPEEEPAPAQEEEPTEGEEPPVENNEEGIEPPTEEPPTEEGPSPDESSAGGDEGVETTDYSADALDLDEGSEEGEPGGDEGSSEPNNGGGAEGADDAPNPDTLAADLMSMENKLLTELTPEQLQIKHQELKKKYDEIYNMIDPIINRINNLSKDNATLRVYDFVNKKLNELRDLVSHYLIKVYPTKTYVENLINYEEYIAILHQIDRVLEQISAQNDQKSAE